MSSTPRLFVDRALAAGPLSVEGPPAHYLARVLRARAGMAVELFDDRTGAWAARVTEVGRHAVRLEVEQRLAARETPLDLWLVAAPIRRQRFEWVVEKATELGAAAIRPVLTRRTIVDRLNAERLRAHMVEAAEQCGRTALPELREAVPLAALLAAWPPERILLWADETGGRPMAALAPAPPAALLIGPEGGWDEEERALLGAHEGVVRLSLGPLLLRADTAAVAALALFRALSTQARRRYGAGDEHEAVRPCG